METKIKDIHPVFDVHPFDVLAAELQIMMGEVMNSKTMTPELVQKASTVNMLAASIAKVHTDKISSAVLLAQNADVIYKMLKK